MQYSDLSKKAQRVIKPDGLPEQIRLGTKKHYYLRAVVLIIMFPLSASLVMAINLDGVQQTFYQVVVVLCILLATLSLSLSHKLILDISSYTRYLELKIWHFSLHKTTSEPLNNTALLLRRSSADHKQFEMKVHQHTYAIGCLTEATEAVRFISFATKIQATEQVSHFPEIRILERAPVKMAMVDDNNIAGTYAADVSSIWRPMTFAKFLLPWPFLLLLGFVIRLIGAE